MRVLVSTSAEHQAIAQATLSAFSSLGHSGELFFDDQSLYLSLFRVSQWSPFRKTAVDCLSQHKRYISAQLYRAARRLRPDIILVIQGRYFTQEAIGKITSQLQIPVFNWLVRDPIFADFYDQLQIQHLSSYGGFFIADELWLPCLYFFEKKVTYLPLAGENDGYYPKSLPRDIEILFMSDLFPPSPFTTSGFIGACVLDYLLANNFPLTAAVENVRLMRKFFPRLRQLISIRSGHSSAAINDLYNRAQIVLNLSPLDYKKDFSSTIFNAALAQSFQLVGHKDNLSRFFPVGVPSFRSLSQLKELLARFTHHPQEREAAAALAYRQAREHHTYAKRVEKIIATVHES